MKPSKNHTLGQSFSHAFEGFVFALRSERNMKIHCAAAVLVITAAVLLGLSPAEKAVLLVLCASVITAELFNTAIENAVDLASPGINPLAKRAKDVAAAAVLVIAATAAVVGIIIFWPYAMNIVRYIQKIV